MDALVFVPILVVSFSLALIATPVSRQIALRLGVVDKPNQRKIHTDHKPLMGGLAIVVALAAALLLFAVPEAANDARGAKLLAVLVGAGLLALTGLLDDRFGLGVRVRLLAQAGAAALAMAAGVQIRLLGLPLVDLTLTLLWMVGLTNALNFLDNMDGLSAGLSAIAASYFLLIGLAEGLPLVSSIAAAIMGGAGGFLVYNFNPASTFMGDMGALMLGYLLAVLGVELKFGAQPLNVTWMVPLLVLSVPLFDITLVVLTRLLERRPIWQAGKDHTSHRLMSLGLSQRWTLLVLYGAAALFGGFALVVADAVPAQAFTIGAFGIALLVVLFMSALGLRRGVPK